MYPKVAIIVVNFNGETLLADCFNALLDQNYPLESLELIMVDNGSTDTSVSLVQQGFPMVHIVEVEKNIGFAAANNVGVKTATGKYIALINNDAIAQPAWLKNMVDLIETQPEDVVCIASKMLNHDGSRIDFVGTALNLYGRAYQIDEGLPVQAGYHEEIRELLAPCGGAMLIKRDVFLRVGGFDEDYIAYYEDVDLGWRLWLYGYRILFAPQAEVYHKQHQTGNRLPVEQRYKLSEVNALRTIVKNYDDDNFWRVLPFSLFMGVKRALDQSNVDRARYSLGYPVSGTPQAGSIESESSMTRVATSFLVAIDQIADEMPQLLKKRKQIQENRIRTDKEVFSRFSMRLENWLFPWRYHHIVQNQLIKDLEIPENIHPHRGTKLLIITHETIGDKMAGPGIRAWEIACALATQFEITLVASARPTRTSSNVTLVGYETEADLAPYIAHTDVVLAQAHLFSKFNCLKNLNKPTIVDLYDPFVLEKLTQVKFINTNDYPKIDLNNKIELLFEAGIGDFFICASEKQKDFWLGVLLAAGRINTATYTQDPTLRQLIEVVPFGIPSILPTKKRQVLKGVHPSINKDDKLLFWNGGLWQWFDPLTLIEALNEIIISCPEVKLFFAAGQHFASQTVSEMPIYSQVIQRCQELGLLDTHVFFGDWIPYDERDDYLLEADIAVSLHQPSLESRFSFRTRLLDCIWAGLPVVCTEGDVLSELIVKHGVGETVPPNQPDILAKTILEMLAEKNLRQQVSNQAKTIQERFYWRKLVNPITNFLKTANFSPDAALATKNATRFQKISNQVEQITRFYNQEIQEQKNYISLLKKQITQQHEHILEHRKTIEHQNDIILSLQKDTQHQHDIILSLQKDTQHQHDIILSLQKDTQHQHDIILSLQKDTNLLQNHIDSIKQGRVMRLLRGLSIILGRE